MLQFVYLAIGRETLIPNHVMYTSLVDVLSKAGQPRAAFYFFEEMMKKGKCPDTVAFNAIIGTKEAILMT